MSAPDLDSLALDCALNTVISNLTPFYLAAANGNQAAAACTILTMIRVYQPVTAPEIELAGRIIGFSAAAADDLRLSMKPGLSETKVLPLRSNANSLERAADKCRAALLQMQDMRRETDQWEADMAAMSKNAAGSAAKASPTPSAAPFATPAGGLTMPRAAAHPPAAANGSAPFAPAR